jgi:hypothetical protein
MLAGERRVGIPGLPTEQESGHVLSSPSGHRGDSGIISARASQGLDQAVPINFIVHNVLPSILAMTWESAPRLTVGHWFQSSIVGA